MAENVIPSLLAGIEGGKKGRKMLRFSSRGYRYMKNRFLVQTSWILSVFSGEKGTSRWLIHPVYFKRYHHIDIQLLCAVGFQVVCTAKTGPPELCSVIKL